MSVELLKQHRVTGNTFSARLELENWSESDTQLIAAFGDPIVDAGGVFDDSTTTFTLDTNEVRLLRDFPFTQKFDGADDAEEARARRDLWSATLEERIVDALTELRARAATHLNTRTVTTI